MKKNFDKNFIEAIKVIHSSKGKCVITGIGKSAHIGQKVVATMNSTGTPAQFLHASEAIHGDLGLVQSDDVVIAISKSGGSPEIINLLPFIKKNGNKIIAITCNKQSVMAQWADVVLDIPLEKEADPNGLAPTTSTMLQLVLGDALAIALQQMNQFTKEDFAKFHPGGALGKLLLWKVNDLMKMDNSPKISINAMMPEVINSLSSAKNGITVLIENEQPKAVITDGDLRRMLVEHSGDFLELKAADIASFNPKTIEVNESAKKAWEMMNEFDIGQLVVINKEGEYLGILDIYELNEQGFG